MSALPPEQARTMRTAARDPEPGEGAWSPASFTDQWHHLHAEAAQVARLAQLSPEPIVGPLAQFPSELNRAPQWQRALAQQGVEDIEAMIRPGLAALEIVTQRKGAATAPALALWREFYNARRAIMAITHP